MLAYSTPITHSTTYLMNTPVPNEHTAEPLGLKMYYSKRSLECLSTKCPLKAPHKQVIFLWQHTVRLCTRNCDCRMKLFALKLKISWANLKSSHSYLNLSQLQLEITCIPKSYLALHKKGRSSLITSCRDTVKPQTKPCCKRDYCSLDRPIGLE